MSAIKTLQTLLDRLQAHSSLAPELTFRHVQQFLLIGRRLLPEIQALDILQGGQSKLQGLPQSCAQFLSSVLSLSLDQTYQCWKVFGDVITSDPNGIFEESIESVDDLFRVHGVNNSIGSIPISSGLSHCPRDSCHGKRLTDERKTEGRLYTLRRGVLPVFPKSNYCRTCKTRYYPSYCVKDALNQDAQREYYSAVLPDILHVSESSYVESDLAVFFETQMAFQHASAQSIARVYDLSLGASHLPNASTLSSKLSDELVYDTFYLHALLRHHNLTQSPLVLPHHGLQHNRYDNALEARNYFMAGTGQEMWAHACKKCLNLYKAADGKTYYLSAGVTDGVTVNHTCCSIQGNCMNPLDSPRDRFCPEHSHKKLECFVEDCLAPAQPGRLSCSDESHSTLEVSRGQRNRKALKELRRRLAKAGVRIIPQAGGDMCVGDEQSTLDDTAKMSTPDIDTADPGPSPFKGKKKVPNAPSPIKGRTTRKYTHNEQLFVRCCGIIVSRATFYHAEGVAAVKDFLKATFPNSYPGSLPTYIFFDKNCQLLGHLYASKDHYFDRTGLPVDVFHASNCHHETDTFCNVHCNPAMFEELVDPSQPNGWRFNSSAAEQANVWFGAFHSIVREMPIAKYNFYLDEMIAIRNRFIAEELRRRGHCPHLTDLDILRQPL